MSKKLTREQFIERSREVHGDKYDYSKSKYKNCYTKLTIICKEHGEFEQSFNHHVSGQGCKKCGSIKQSKSVNKTTPYFIEKAKKKHGDKYDYSEVDYINSDVKVKIICKEHGVFEQLPHAHLQGHGCLSCSRISRTEIMKKDTNYYIEKAKKIHGDKYDYSKAVHVNNTTKVEIICKTHGSFFQTFKSHTNGTTMCPKCSKIKKSLKATNNLEDFLKRVKEIHKDTYTYEKTDYVKGNIKTTITCKVHGDFQQKPSAHLRGKGCLKCSQDLGTYRRSEYIKIAKGREVNLYLIKFKNCEEEFYKIGKTVNNIKKRFAGYKYEYEVIHTYKNEAGYIYDLENKLHRQYKDYKYKPNNLFAGYTECYSLNLPIEEIINISIRCQNS